MRDSNIRIETLLLFSISITFIDLEIYNKLNLFEYYIFLLWKCDKFSTQKDVEEKYYEEHMKSLDVSAKFLLFFSRRELLISIMNHWIAYWSQIEIFRVCEK